MTRELKFRFFREKPSPKMIYPEADFYLTYCGQPVGLVKQPKKRVYMVGLDVIPLQYTGLKDKNDKEIYEGDIVRYKNRIGEIHWHKYQASFDLKFLRNIEGEPYISLDEGLANNIWPFQLEIIGNIYENPELLK